MNAYDFEERVVTREMCDALQRLQTVRSYDYNRAYHEAFAGLQGSRPLKELREHGSAIRAAFFEGGALALAVWVNRHDVDAA